MKRIPFSYYKKCNTSHFKVKTIYFFKKKDFLVFFSFYFHDLIENERKSKIYINFLLQFIFFFQNCINYPFSSVFKRINILSKKDHLFLVQKKGVYAISRKKTSVHQKSEIFDDFLLISLFSSKINKIHWVLWQYTFFWKNS